MCINMEIEIKLGLRPYKWISDEYGTSSKRVKKESMSTFESLIL